MVRLCSENGKKRLLKIALKWMPKQKRARGRSNKNWMEVYKEGHEQKKPKGRHVGR
jgi:hypothetical protein